MIRPEHIVIRSTIVSAEGKPADTATRGGALATAADAPAPRRT